MTNNEGFGVFRLAPGDYRVRAAGEGVEGFSDVYAIVGQRTEFKLVLAAAAAHT